MIFFLNYLKYVLVCWSASSEDITRESSVLPNWSFYYILANFEPSRLVLNQVTQIHSNLAVRSDRRDGDVSRCNSNRAARNTAIRSTLSSHLAVAGCFSIGLLLPARRLWLCWNAKENLRLMCHVYLIYIFKNEQWIRLDL
jgi:hypothetical protein